MLSRANPAACLLLVTVLVAQCRAVEKESLLPDKDKCGLQKTKGEVLEGTSAEIGEFPWTVLLRYQDAEGNDAGFRGLGTLISDKYVLTTGTCATPDQVTIVGVRFGEYDLSTEKDCKDKEQTECTDAVQDFGVEEVIPHKDFDRKDYNNDIALIKLNETVKFTDYIQPICLPLHSETVKPGDKVTATGWGRSIMGKLVTRLKRVVSTVVSNEECSEDYKNSKRTITANHICTKAYRNNTEFTCNGDSGGPLMSYSDGHVFLQGLVSFGIGCGYKLADGHTRIANYLDWILEHISP